MSTIPASAIVSVTPGVLAAGGSPLSLNGILLTTSNRTPIGAVQPFSNATDVADYFGLSSTEYAAALIYFSGFDNSNIKPGRIFYTQYNTTDVQAWLRGGNVSGMTLTQLQGLSGSLTVTIDGTPVTGSINLSAATSFSNAAEIIGVTMGIEGIQIAAFTAAIATTTMTVSAFSSGDGSLSAGDVVNGSGVTANTYIVEQLTGDPGSTGTYTVSASQIVGSESMTADSPGVTYDSVTGGFQIWSGTKGAASTISYGSGAFATSILLTQELGGVISQGADAQTSPSAFMTAIPGVTQNWATFMTLFDPDSGSGHVNKLKFALWTTQQNDRYAYIAWDTDVTPTETVPATSSFGYALQQGDYSGTCVIFSPTYDKAAFICGSVASIDFTETNGRTTLAFRHQGGLVADVTTQTAADNLLANGYNFYGAYATANDEFIWFYNGSISGPFLWLDSFANQIWLNNEFQLAFMVLLDNVKSIPYNAAGYELIQAAALDPINAGLNFGAFRPGVTLSEAQRAEVNTIAGATIDTTLQQVGYYFLVKDASPEVRQNRGSPPAIFLYMDGQSVQRLNLSSIDVL